MIALIKESLNIDPINLTPLEGYESQNFLVETVDNKYLVKLYKSPKLLAQIKEEQRIIDELSQGLSFDLPNQLKPITILHDGSFLRTCKYIEGTFLDKVKLTFPLLIDYGQSIAKMHIGLQTMSSTEIKVKRSTWDLQYALDNSVKLKHIKERHDQKLVHYYLDQFKHDLLTKLASLPQSLIHGDLNENNVLINQDKLAGIIDFGDCSYGARVNDVAIALCYLLMIGKLEFTELLPFVKAYHDISPLSIEELDAIYILIATRLCVSVLHSAEAKSSGKDTAYILISEKPAWRLIRKWMTTNPIKIKNLLREAVGYEKIPTTTLAISTKRANQIGYGLSLSYNEAIHMKSAAFQYMYDAQGNTYLDAYNNIPLIGHSHPRIAETISRKARKLNTNTRYHYDEMTNYSEHLLSYFPKKLSRLYLVNSGSAASDLATRLARTHTGRNTMAVSDHGYHGNSNLGVELSPYKFNGKGGNGASSNIITLKLAKEYNGTFKTSEEYLNDALNILNNNIEQNNKPAALITECISGCGGQVPLIKGYLKSLSLYLKTEGILLITDEVQTGFGRLGVNFWGFEMMDVVPDIVVLGKPMGNGHPIGAVVTTEEISRSFDNGMEFFSSFGGNPISCAIGKTVLEVVEQEGSQVAAKEVGNYFKSELASLQAKHPVIGDVRGAGLFLGIEFNNTSAYSSTLVAKKVKEQMKQQFILTSTDGPLDNVLKIKPPLCFNKSNVDQFVDELAKILIK